MKSVKTLKFFPHDRTNEIKIVINIQRLFKFLTKKIERKKINSIDAPTYAGAATIG